MNLHRASTKPDWERIPAAERSAVQRLAAATHGVITPPNIITVIGFAIVVYGLWLIVHQEYIIGTVLLAVGRALDIADGLVAELTKTKSLLGEMCDAVADKVGTLLTVVTLFAVDAAPWWVVAGLVIPQIIIPFIIAYKKRKGISMHPTRPGKLSMATAWVGIVGLLIGSGFDDMPAVSTVAYVFVAVSLALGLWAAGQYSRWSR